MDGTDYHALLQIDKHALDDALIEQASVYFTISQDLSQAVSDRDEVKENLDVTDAQLYLDIRADLIDNGEKATEAQVSAQVHTHSKHEGAMKDLLKARKQVDVLGALKDSFQQRSYMLRELVELYIAGYFMQSADKGTGGGRGKSDSQYKRNREKIKDSFKK